MWRQTLEESYSASEKMQPIRTSPRTDMASSYLSHGGHYKNMNRCKATPIKLMQTFDKF